MRLKITIMVTVFTDQDGLTSREKQEQLHMSSSGSSSVTQTAVGWLAALLAVIKPSTPPPPSDVKSAHKRTTWTWFATFGINVRCVCGLWKTLIADVKFWRIGCEKTLKTQTDVQKLLSLQILQTTDVFKFSCSGFQTNCVSRHICTWIRSN